MKFPELAGNIYDWLAVVLAREAERFKNRPVLLDIGGYHGDFSARVLEWRTPLRQAVIFEPNPENLKHLRARFAGRTDVQIEPLACGDEPGERDFFVAGQAYTGSLLAYSEGQANAQKSKVQCVRLDDHLEAAGLAERIGFLKVDCQGNDLRVLRGATRLLQQTRPWVLVEVIHAPLYNGQARPAELFSQLDAWDYALAAQFNEHYSDRGWFGWADACFLPREQIDFAHSSWHKRPMAKRRGIRRLWDNLTRD